MKKKSSLIYILMLVLTTFSLFSEEPLTNSQPTEEDTASFLPPSGWNMVEPSALTKTVKAMVVGKGENMLPPSMNLATQPYNGTLKDYLKLVKTTNDAKGEQWKDLGTIKTASGPASLSQVDSPSQYGIIRNMHVILLINNHIYILTASALKEEFPKYYKEFFNSLRSLKVNIPKHIQNLGI